MLLLVASILSIALSVISTINALPNNDGILYMNSAGQFLSNGFSSAMSAYDWPFYSLLIALGSKLTGLSLLHSAYAIDTLLQLLIILSFLNIFNKFKPTKTQLLCALITILIFPQFNDHRTFIIRDFGYWAFNLMAIGNFMTFSAVSINIKARCTASLLLYYICFGLAFLFRSESIVLMLCMPLSLIFLEINKQIRNKKILYIYSPFLITTAGLFIFMLFVLCTGFYKHLLDSLYTTIVYTLQNNLKFNIISLFLSAYSTKIQLLNSTIFATTPISSLASIAFLWVGLCVALIVQYIILFNIVNFGFLLIFIKYYRFIFNNNNTNINNLKLIGFVIFISMVIPTAFLYTTFIYTARYYLLSAFLLLLFVPFGLDYFWQMINLNHKKYKNTYAIALTSVLSIICTSGLVHTNTKASKEYIKQAGLWYKNQNLPIDQISAASNNPQLAYYAGLENIADDKLNISQNKFKYLLIKISKKHNNKINEIEQLAQKKQISILKTFANKRNDTAFIIKNNN